MNKQKGLFILVCSLMLGSLLLAACGTSNPGPATTTGDLPRTLAMGTMPAGMSVNAQGVGIADIISKYTPIAVSVIPSTNEEAWVPKMVSDEIQLGVAVSLPMRQAYLAIGPYTTLAQQTGVKSFPVRLVAVGSPMRTNLIVSGDSPITGVPDLKGKTVVSYPKGSAFDLYTRALLANGGLSLDDVKTIPAPNPVEGTKAIMEGRADANMVAVDAPVVTEAVAKINARFLPMDPSPDAVDRMKKVIETAYVEKTPGGSFVGLPEPLELMHIDTYFIANENVNAAAIKELLEALWANNSELLEKPALGEWKAAGFLTSRPGIPYHQGAIEFYQEKGLWNGEIDKEQQTLVQQTP